VIPAKPQILTRSVRSFLQASRVARLATIGEDGYPHVIPIWFIRDKQDILFGCNRTDRKVRNLLTNPNGAVVIGGDSTDERGYLIRGDLSLEEDSTHVVLRKLLARYATKRDTARLLSYWAHNDFVVIRLKPKSVVRVF
jgi:nitroimidazol reductase NimA-like FMN-containing flavoprotein (pyridoxamine 5'-phosphate oxidase superfamily)